MGESSEILVVGAGPTGLTLASELYRHGVPCRIVDKADGAVKESRASDVQARTLEVMHDMGVVDEALSLGHPHTGIAIHADGRWLARIPFEGVDSPYPYSFALSQDVTERLLGRHLESLGGRVERGVEVARVDDDGDGARAVLLHHDGHWEKVRPRWIVGCDGASSGVRIGLGLPFDGTSFEERFWAVDTSLVWDQPSDVISAFYAAETFMFVIPMDGGARVRLFMEEPPGEQDLTLDKVRDILARTVPFPTRIDDLRWMSRFRIHSRVAPRYRVGRVFLAGDACHIHSPVTGQGLNLGIQDAYNLAWKLALVVTGKAPERLLDSYEAERRPVAANVVALADTGQRRAMIRSRFGQTLRNNVLELMARFPSVMKRVSEINLQITHNYRGSPAVAEERTGLLQANVVADRSSEHPSVGDWREFDAAPQPGDRVPDLRVPGGTLFQKLRGTHHTLLLFDGRAPTPGGYVSLARIAEDARRRWDALVRPVIVVHGRDRPKELSSSSDESVWLDADGALHARFGAGAECLYLVRPDGYVGFRAQPASGESIVRYMSRVLL